MPSAAAAAGWVGAQRGEASGCWQSRRGDKTGTAALPSPPPRGPRSRGDTGSGAAAEGVEIGIGGASAGIVAGGAKDGPNTPKVGDAEGTCGAENPLPPARGSHFGCWTGPHTGSGAIAGNVDGICTEACAAAAAAADSEEKRTESVSRAPGSSQLSARPSPALANAIADEARRRQPHRVADHSCARASRQASLMACVPRPHHRFNIARGTDPRTPDARAAIGSQVS
mmetsp:Transcript_250/g.1058  ORF Transcript_250/g.1058 Transcript_250/m.1058 type:complete len:227 (+) Transcript_250:2224-2904(+)